MLYGIKTDKAIWFVEGSAFMCRQKSRVAQVSDRRDSHANVSGQERWLTISIATPTPVKRRC